MKQNFFLGEEFSNPIPSSRYGLWTSSQSFITVWISNAETLLPPPPPSMSMSAHLASLQSSRLHSSFMGPQDPNTTGSGTRHSESYLSKSASLPAFHSENPNQVQLNFLSESSPSLYYLPYARGPLSCLSLTTVPLRSLLCPAPALTINRQGRHLCLSWQYWTVLKAGALTCMQLWGSGSTSSTLSCTSSNPRCTLSSRWGELLSPGMRPPQGHRTQSLPGLRLQSALGDRLLSVLDGSFCRSQLHRI